MDDVLPKPFTRKSLLDMLEKHLMHLKKVPLGLEQAPQSATATSINQSSTTHSLKDDSSPGQSPAGSMGNWHSPGQYPGVSPIHANLPNQYLPVQNHSPYIEPNGSASSFASPQTPSSARMPTLPQQQPHRRQVSEMSGVADTHNYNKRQRLYGQPAPSMTQAMPGRPQ